MVLQPYFLFYYQVKMFNSIWDQNAIFPLPLESNSIFAHNYAKVFLLKAYVAVHKFDIIRISETYLDSSTHSDNSDLEISGYTIVYSEHPSNKKEGVFLFITKAFYL